jgi:membrane protein implicated in regulation of membrane protease activity
MLTLIALVVAVLFLSSPWNVVVVATAAIVDIAETGVLVWWSRRRRRLSPAAVGLDAIVGRLGIALTRLDPGNLEPGALAAVGQVRIDGEIWSARSAEPIDPGTTVTVRSVDGLVLEVESAW